jgi:hypothetical protein
LWDRRFSAETETVMVGIQALAFIFGCKLEVFFEVFFASLKFSVNSTETWDLEDLGHEIN